MRTSKRSISTKKKNHIPRPKNSFMIYRQERQYEAAKHIEGNNNKDISKLVGKWWNNETEEVKAYYRKKAEEAKKVHSKLYPNYRYCPKKSVKNNNQHPQLPILSSNATRHHYKDYSQFPYTQINHLYANNEILAIPPCTCCDIIYPTQSYNLQSLPIQESLEAHQYFNGLDLTNTAITTPAAIIPPLSSQYETPPQAFLPEYTFNYLTPITQSPASVASGTFTQTSDNQLNLGYWNNDPNLPFNEILPMYNLLPNQYELSAPEASGFVNPNVIYPLDPSTTNCIN